MPKTVEITCDLCERDITRTTNCEGYRLALVNERMPTVGGFVTSMAAYPAIERDAYFCGVGCLAVWLADKYPQAGEEYERAQKHRAWLREKEAEKPAL